MYNIKSVIDVMQTDLLMWITLSSVVGFPPKTILLSPLTLNLETSVEPGQLCFQPY